MTVAAGFLYKGGALLCADTLVADSMSARYQSKIMGYGFGDGMAVFALAGYATLAQSAVQQCSVVLSATPKKKRTHAEIADAIRPVLARAYRQQVVNSGMKVADCAYVLVAAIWSQKNGLALYRSDLASLAESATANEYIGSGGELAEFIIRPLYEQAARMVTAVTEKELLPLAGYALSKIRGFQPQYVGGDPVVFILRSSGEWSFWRKKDFEMLATRAGNFDVAAFSWLRSFLSAESVEEFSGMQKQLAEFLESEKADWLKQQKEFIWGEVTHHARKVMKRLPDKSK